MAIEVGLNCPACGGAIKIVEGEKERVQVFSGTVIGRRGQGISESFTVRRIVNNEGVERTFPLHSPKVGAIDIVRSGRTRRAKLYFLRDRVGKKTRLKDLKKVIVPGEGEAPVTAEAPVTPEQAPVQAPAPGAAKK